MDQNNLQNAKEIQPKDNTYQPIEEDMPSQKNQEENLYDEIPLDQPFVSAYIESTGPTAPPKLETDME